MSPTRQHEEEGDVAAGGGERQASSGGAPCITLVLDEEEEIRIHVSVETEAGERVLPTGHRRLRNSAEREDAKIKFGYDGGTQGFPFTG